MACGGGADVLDLHFPDELVEAPARSVELAVSADTDCATLLTVDHDSLESVGTILARRTLRYPVSPDAAPFEDMPRGQALAVDVSVLDEGGLQISRSCVTTTLEADAKVVVSMEMHGLALCEASPTALDLTLLIDTSTGMRDATIALEGDLLTHVEAFVATMGVTGGVRFSILTHGHTAPEELLAPTDDKQLVTSALESLQGVAAGDAVHYEGLTLAASLLRDRAVCGRRPAILWMAGGADESPPGAYEIAAVGLAGTRGEFFDDIYFYAVGISDPAVAAIQLMTNGLSVSDWRGARSGVALDAALNDAHFRLQGLVEP